MKPRKKRYSKSTHEMMRSLGCGPEYAKELLARLDAVTDGCEMGEPVDVPEFFGLTEEDMFNCETVVELYKNFNRLTKSAQRRLDKMPPRNALFLLNLYKERLMQ